MINLQNDYCGIAHPEVIKKITEKINNLYVGYGLDEETKEAEAKIKCLIGNEKAQVHFLQGGTITNKVVLGHILKPYEAVICADSGHINVHETGAIESDGHKVLTVKNFNGKIALDDLENIIMAHQDEHMVKPKVVYISNTTEIGTVYNLEELKQLYLLCKKHNLYLYLDGARLASALNSSYCDITFKDLGKYCDAFYIGGTKNGLMNGEALVVNNVSLQTEIRYSIKHFGGMIAKGFINGIQFNALFENDLFNRIGREENELALYLYKSLKSIGVEMLMECQSNQIFPIFKNADVEKLKKDLMFEVWEKRKEKTVVRFVAHFLLTKEDIDNTVEIIRKSCF